MRRSPTRSHPTLCCQPVSQNPQPGLFARVLYPDDLRMRRYPSPEKDCGSPPLSGPQTNAAVAPLLRRLPPERPRHIAHCEVCHHQLPLLGFTDCFSRLVQALQGKHEIGEVSIRSRSLGRQFTRLIGDEFLNIRLQLPNLVSDERIVEDRP